MPEHEALAGFVDKWRARWPEWSVAEVFVTADQRASARAWLALLQELTDAAWGGGDARPGEAKLAWWQEELQGWGAGRRRHPLGEILAGLALPWPALATALPALRDSRERPRDTAAAVAALAPFAIAVAAIEARLFDTPAATASSGDVASALLGHRLLWHRDDAAPLQVLARADAAAVPAAWAAALLVSWPAGTPVARVRRLHAALLRARLRQLAAGAVEARPLSRWDTLWLAWRAARSG